MGVLRRTVALDGILAMGATWAFLGSATVLEGRECAVGIMAGLVCAWAAFACYGARRGGLVAPPLLVATVFLGVTLQLALAL